MNKLYTHYEKNNDYANMIKYYERLIINGNTDAINNLAKYYENQNDDENIMTKIKTILI
jgi:hypothetical protein